jgi:molecular chaperone DnaJ
LNCPELEYYQILGLEDTANKETISKAYKKLSILTHPDRSKDPDATRAFQSKSKLPLVRGRRQG